MAELNKKQIENLEEEFLKLQEKEDALGDENAKSRRLVAIFGGLAGYYLSKSKQKKFIFELEKILADIAKSGRVSGKVLSAKTMREYLSKSERAMHSVRVIDALDRAGSIRAKKRMKLYIMELAKERSILKADIDLFLARGKLSGLTEKEVLRRLVLAAESSTGPMKSFEKRLITIEKSILRREASATEIDEYLKVAEPNELWQWITISVNPCPDCEIRAGVILPFPEWQDQGLPGDGHTICRSSCMCKLLPYSVSEELFPEVKTFKWDKESGVLTTPSEMKEFSNLGGNVDI